MATIQDAIQAVNVRVNRHKLALHAVRLAGIEARQDDDLTYMFFDERESDILAGLYSLKQSLLTLGA